MKIAYFLGTLNKGGFESLILDVCQRHNQTPFEFICMYRHEGAYIQAFKETGATLVHVPCKNKFSYIIAIRRVIKKYQIDIVHSQTPSNTLVLALALLNMRTKIITTMHGFNFSKVVGLYQKIVYHFSKKILCVSEYQKSVYEQNWHLTLNNKLQVIYNGINVHKFDEISYDSNVKYILDGSNPIKLCMVGNFVNVRSQIVIIHSLELLKQRGINNFDFYFIGRRVETECDLYDNCLKYCTDNHLSNVHFLGAQANVPELLQQMDGFVYSSASDTFGIAVVEALVTGLPTIVNDWVVMKEVTQNGKWATLFETEDSEDCADKIQELIEHLPERKVQAQKIAKEVREEYSIEKHICRLYEVYTDVLVDRVG